MNSPPSPNPEPVSGRAGLRRVGSRKDMGERAEPMQWVLARHRQNSGEQRDEDTDNLIDYLPLAVHSRVHGKPARRGTDIVTCPPCRPCF